MSEARVRLRECDDSGWMAGHFENAFQQLTADCQRLNTQTLRATEHTENMEGRKGQRTVALSLLTVPISSGWGILCHTRGG
jgi:hypothetical protein